MPFKHAAAARPALAVFGLSAAVFASAALLGAVAGFIGTRATIGVVLLTGAVFSGCRLWAGLRPHREPRLTRPAPVRLPEVTKPQEPARTAA